MLPSAGTYFINVDLAPSANMTTWHSASGSFAEHGVAAIPVSAFYAQDAIKSVVRFCFAKKDAVLDAALERLETVARKAA